MDATNATSQIDFATQLRRSSGRQPRKISATAKMTRAEHNELETAARTDGKALGEWCRDVLLRKARKEECDPSFTELVAMRLLLNTVLKRIACGEAMTAESFNHEIQRIRNDKQKVANEVLQTYREQEGVNDK